MYDVPSLFVRTMVARPGPTLGIVSVSVSSSVTLDRRKTMKRLRTLISRRSRKS